MNFIPSLNGIDQDWAESFAFTDEHEKIKRIKNKMIEGIEVIYSSVRGFYFELENERRNILSGKEREKINLDQVFETLIKMNPDQKEIIKLFDDMITEAELNPKRNNRNFFDDFLANRE